MKRFDLKFAIGLNVVGVLFCHSLTVAAPAKNTKYPVVQAYIDSTIALNPQVEEINIYAEVKGKKGLNILGSNDLTLLNKKADPEDLQVFSKNKAITLTDPDDPEITDITYPIVINGKTIGVMGLMFHAIPGKTGPAFTAATDDISKKIINGFIAKTQSASKPIF